MAQYHPRAPGGLPGRAGKIRGTLRRNPGALRYFWPDEVGPLVDELLALQPRPDAFFTASDRLAVGCLAALRQRRIGIPDDISLIGFTNLTVADMLSPSMSTVEQPAKEIGQEAVGRLLDLIEQKHRAAPPATLTIPTTMVVRESSSRPAVVV
ncbi:substrate-binding domain-containing protein [Hymenobacter sp. BRD67]|uniref:substrate-binding domain-containing protein n=1 Tax=Hymenobacter sp. BRD67 TaxID=2675877 RepID=UPI00293BE15D|nr:substrate-binding domain-containing protein [Hymenobacter sp. BRD67]